MSLKITDILEISNIYPIDNWIFTSRIRLNAMSMEVNINKDREYSEYKRQNIQNNLIRIQNTFPVSIMNARFNLSNTREI